MHIVIAVSRIICVFFPMIFRKIGRRHYIGVFVVIWTIGLIQSGINCFFSW